MVLQKIVMGLKCSCLVTVVGQVACLITLPGVQSQTCDPNTEFLVSTYFPAERHTQGEPRISLNNTSHGAFLRHLEDAVAQCCHPAARLHIQRIADTARHMEEGAENETFLVPVTRTVGHLSSYSFGAFKPPVSFLPLVESPGAFMFVATDSDDTPLITTILSAWPILLVIVSTSGFSAIFIWLLDRYSNPTSFPKPFLRGTWEGLWWAVVSMTTVGYGDRTPVSVPGRLFGMTWILVGVIIMAVFTATLTTSFTEESANFKNIQGLRVGVLNGSAEESLAFLLGAQVTVYNHVEPMVQDMKQEILDAGLLNNLVTLSHAPTFKEYRLKLSSFISAPAVHGVMVRNLDDMDFQRCLTLYTEKKRFSLMDEIQSFAEPLERRRGKEGPQKMANILSKCIVVIYIVCGMLVICLIALGIKEIVCCHKKKRTCGKQDQDASAEMKSNPITVSGQNDR